VYLDFLKKIHALCERHGKRMNAWADIVLDHAELLPDVPKGIVMLNWDYHPRGSRIPRTREIVAAGLPAMVCPGTNAWNSHGCRLEMGMKNIARFAAEGLKCGVEGLLNTDWGDGGHRNMLAVSLHNYAYGAAQSWHPRGVTDAGFTERFCRHVFAAAGAGLPDAIRTLGRADEALGLEYSNGGVLYRIVLGRMHELVRRKDWTVEPLDRIAPAAFARHAGALGRLAWPRPRSLADPLLQLSLEEFALATQLDTVACLRARAIQQLRAGEAPSAAERRRLIGATRGLLRRIEPVWLLGNKPSRLRDIVRGLRQAVSEYGRLARR